MSGATSTKTTATDKVTPWYTEFRFGIVLAIGVLAECFILFLTGLSGNSYVYGPMAIVIIALFNVAFMLWPAVQTVIHPPTRLIAVLRFAIIVGSFIYIILVMLQVMRLNTVTVGTLYHLPAVGCLFTVGAVVLNALAAFFLTNFGSRKKSAKLKILKMKIQPLEESIATQQVRVNNTTEAVKAREDILTLEQAREDVEDGLAKATLKIHDAAKTAYENDSNVKALAQAKKDVVKGSDYRGKLSDRLSAKLTLLDNPKLLAAQRKNIQKEVNELASELDRLVGESDELDGKVKELEASAESGEIKELKEAFDIAIENNRLANAEKAKVMKDVEAANTALTEATNTQATEAVVLSQAKQELATTNEKIKTLSGKISNVWRDLFVPFIILVGALATYPVWYGSGVNLPG